MGALTSQEQIKAPEEQIKDLIELAQHYASKIDQMQQQIDALRQENGTLRREMTQLNEWAQDCVKTVDSELRPNIKMAHDRISRLEDQEFTIDGLGALTKTKIRELLKTMSPYIAYINEIKSKRNLHEADAHEAWTRTNCSKTPEELEMFIDLRRNSDTNVQFAQKMLSIYAEMKKIL